MEKLREEQKAVWVSCADCGQRIFYEISGRVAHGGLSYHLECFEAYRDVVSLAKIRAMRELNNFDIAI